MMDPCECKGCRPCPECGEKISAGVVRCKHCRAYVGGFLGSPTGMGCRWGFFLALLAAIALLALCCGLASRMNAP